MLQTNKDVPAVERGLEIFSPEETLQSVVAFLRRQLSVILFAVILTIALASVYVITTPPSFTAQARLMIDSRKNQAFQQQSIPGDIPIDSAYVESQVEILKSENVALAVIKDLHLTEDPEFVNPGGGLIGALLELVPSFSTDNEASSEFELTRRAIGAFQARLGVKRFGLTYVIEISFRSSNPERAAQITNAVADAYVVDQLEAKYQATRRAGVWLQDRIRELREQASTAQRAVVEFRTKNNIVSTGGTDGRLMDEQQVAELNSQLVIAQAQTSEARARLDRIQAVLRADSPNATVDATVADVLKNEVITKLRSQYLEYARREADFSARVGPNHLATVNLRNQMREIRVSILDELRRIAETYKSDFEIAKQREEGVQKQLGLAVSQSQTTNQAQVALRELESNAKTYQLLYDNFLQRYMESVQQQSFPISEARLISSASRPLSKSHPRTLFIVAIAGFGGIVLGLGLGVLRDLSDRVFRTSSQVESLLRISCIAVVPLLKNEAPGAEPHRPKGSPAPAKLARAAGDLSRQPKGTPDPSASRTIIRKQNLLWTVVDAPLSRFAEGIRAVKLAADLNSVVKPNKVIGFTSSLPNEGKSTISNALAQLIAQAGRSVILVDCDIRNPSLSRGLTPNAKSGLIEVIAGKISLKDAVWKDETTNMTFLPAVTRSHLAQSSEIIASEATKRLFDQLRQTYEYVVVDLPPLSPIVDTRATTHLVDSYLLVIEWGRTKIDVVEHALGDAPGIYDNLLGAVLNKTDMDTFGRYDSHHENYYYHKHYTRYGYTE